MKIATFIMCHNEERLLPYTLRHYLSFSEVTILENNSTDRSVEIAKEMGAKVWDIHCNDVLDDDFHVSVKDNCWKVSDADWVIVVDADELVYCPNIKEVLANTKATVIQPALYNMCSEHFPTTDGQIYDEVKMGCSGGGKINLIKRKEIKDMNYTAGCHKAYPTGNVILETSNEIKTLHYRYLGMDYIMERNNAFGSRLSENNIRKRYGYHMNFTRERVEQEYREKMANLLQVL